MGIFPNNWRPEVTSELRLQVGNEQNLEGWGRGVYRTIPRNIKKLLINWNS